MVTMVIEDKNNIVKCECEVCGKSTIQEYIGKTWNNIYYCIECYELISGKKAFLRCLN